MYVTHRISLSVYISLPTPSHQIPLKFGLHNLNIIQMFNMCERVLEFNYKRPEKLLHFDRR